MPKRKKMPNAAIRDYRTQIFVILAFIGSALTTEFVNILHEFAKAVGTYFYYGYCIFILFVWAVFIVTLQKLIEEVYLEKKN